MSMTPFSGLEQQAGDAEAAIRGLEGPAAETAEAIDQAFAKAGESLARSLARAASDGKVSLKDLAGAIIAAVDAAAGTSSSAGGLGAVLSEAFKGVFGGVFGGARADGGPVTAGGAYIVGERGPEMFRPAVAGSVEAVAGGPNVNVTVMVSGGAEALARSEAQVAAALQRAVRMGVR